MPFKDGSWHPTRWLGASTVQQCVWNGMDLECRSLQLSIFLVMSVHSNLFITLETFALLISQKGWQLIARWHPMQPCFMQQSMKIASSQLSKLSQFYSCWCVSWRIPKERPGRGIPTNLWSCLLSLLLPPGHPEASWAQKSRFLGFQDFPESSIIFYNL